MQKKKVLVFIVDSATKDNLVNFSKSVYEKAKYKGQLIPVSEGHTVTSAFALMTGQLVYNEKFSYKMPIGDWVYRVSGEKFKQGNMELYDYHDIADRSIIGKSSLREVWFNIPELVPVPRIANVVIVGGVPLAWYEYYTQPPKLQQEIESKGYIIDVRDNVRPSVDFLTRMEQKRGEIFDYVLSKYGFDIAFCWFTALDRLHHNRVILKNPNDTPENRKAIMETIDTQIFNIYQKYNPDYLILMSDHGWRDDLFYHWSNGFFAIYDGKEHDSPEVRASILDIIPTIYDLVGVKVDGLPGLPISVRAEKKPNFILSHINDKYDKSFEVIKNTFKNFPHDQIAVALSGGKDSTVVAYMSWLVDKDVKMIFVDTTAHFSETYEFIRKLQIGYNMKIYYSQPAEEIIDFAVDKEKCCLVNKVKNLERALKMLNVKVLLTGIRRSDGGTRENEEISRLRKTSDGYEYLQVNPILDWTYDDVMDFLLSEGVPINPLYYNGYRSIDCYPCTLSIFESGDVKERGGRLKDNILGRLRSMGYF